MMEAKYGLLNHQCLRQFWIELLTVHILENVPYGNRKWPSVQAKTSDILLSPAAEVSDFINSTPNLFSVFVQILKFRDNQLTHKYTL